MLIQLPIMLGLYGAISMLVMADAAGNSGLIRLGYDNINLYLFNTNIGEFSLIITLLAGLTTFLTSFFTMIGTQQQNKMLLYLGPVMTIGFGVFLSLPAGLMIY